MLRYRLMHPPLEFCFHLMKLGGQPLPHGGATNQKLATSVYSARVGQPEEVEGLRFSPAVETSAVSARKASVPDQAGLLRMEFQREPLESVMQGLFEASGIILILETDNEIVGPSNYDDVSARLALPPLVCP